MRHIDVERKQPQRWPWVLGIAALVGVLWGVTRLLAPPPEQPAVDVGVTAADTLPPASIPTTDRPNIATLPTIHEITDMADAIGRPVRARGTVVAVDSGAFWIRADNLLLRVATGRRPEPGEDVHVRGALRPLPDSVPAPPDAAGERARVQIVEDGAATRP